MVAVLTALRWRLWRAEFAHARRWVAAILGLLSVLPLFLLAMIGVGTLASSAPEYLPHVLSLGAAMLILGWLVAPLVAGGLDDPLAADRFSRTPLRARELQPALLVASIISIPAVLTTLAWVAALILVMLAIGTGRYPAASSGALGMALVAAPICFGLGLFLCLAAPRAILTAVGVGGISRRGRELLSAFGMIAAIAVLYSGLSFLLGSLETADAVDLTNLLIYAVAIASWTPLGAPAAIPFDLASGAYLIGFARLAIVLVTCVAIWLWWRKNLDEALITPSSLGSGTRLRGSRRADLPVVDEGVMKILPATPLGAVIGRSVRYWLRDSRYFISLLLSPIILAFVLYINRENAAMVLGPFALFTMVVSMQQLINDLGFDGPAGWHAIIHGLDPKTSLRGRGIAALLVTVPTILLATLLAATLAGSLEVMPLAAAMIVGAACTVVGVAAMLCVLLPYPVQAPGTNAFKMNSGQSSAAWISGLAGIPAYFVPMLPAIILALLGLHFWAGFAALAAGFTLLAIGWIAGPRMLADREVEIYHKVKTWAT